MDLYFRSQSLYISRIAFLQWIWRKRRRFVFQYTCELCSLKIKIKWTLHSFSSDHNIADIYHKSYFVWLILFSGILDLVIPHMELPTPNMLLPMDKSSKVMWSIKDDLFLNCVSNFIFFFRLIKLRKSVLLVFQHVLVVQPYLSIYKAEFIKKTRTISITSREKKTSCKVH